MIANTTANCKIKSITINESTASINCIIYSSSPAKTQQGFKFFILDKDGTISEASENIYWIDRLNNYNNDSINVDVNQYLELILKVDITNKNRSLIEGNKWVRHCTLLLKNINDTSKIAWSSENLSLISKEFEIPTIKNLDIYSEEDYSLNISFKHNYNSQLDFNYNNKNLYTTINILSLYTNNILESIDIDEENSYTSEVNTKLLNKFTSPIKIQIQLKTNKGAILSTTERVYIPYIRKTSTFIKTPKGIKQVLAFFVKQNANNNSFVSSTSAYNLRASRNSTQENSTKLTVNFNNAEIKLPELTEPIIEYLNYDTISIINQDIDFLSDYETTVLLDAEFVTTSKEPKIKVTLPREKNDFILTVHTKGSSSFYPIEKEFTINYKRVALCATTTLCAENLLCSDY